MGPNKYIDLTFPHFFQSCALFPRSAETAYQFDINAERFHSLCESHEVLLGQNRSRHQHRHLLAIGDSFESSSDSNLCLAIANVTAEQSVHRHRFFHITFNFFNSLQLVRRFFKRESRFKLSLHFCIRPERMSSYNFPLRIQSQQFRS